METQGLDLSSLFGRQGLANHASTAVLTTQNRFNKSADDSIVELNPKKLKEIFNPENVGVFTDDHQVIAHSQQLGSKVNYDKQDDVHHNALSTIDTIKIFDMVASVIRKAKQLKKDFQGYLLSSDGEVIRDVNSRVHGALLAACEA